MVLCESTASTFQSACSHLDEGGGRERDRMRGRPGDSDKIRHTFIGRSLRLSSPIKPCLKCEKLVTGIFNVPHIRSIRIYLPNKIPTGKRISNENFCTSYKFLVDSHEVK